MSDVFEVPESEADKPENRYRFKIGETEFDIPKLSHVTGEHLDIINRDVYTDTEADQVVCEFLVALVGDEHAEKIRKLDRKQLDALATAYRKASGIDEGESAASSSS